ncbi:MAG: 2-hydroxyacid dehydrogenase [Lachnospiraceae bacterium]|nr:2-hydroxyacid dehydrogenase [Lachnospiraceae bacterium]
MKIAVFDSKSYDIESFNETKEQYIKEIGTDELSVVLDFQFFEDRLTEKTVKLAYGFDAVCVFVNDEVNRQVIDALVEYGVGMIALRCAGFNNVDVAYAKNRIKVVRVPAYSPYAVAEHAMAMLLTLNRKTNKAYIRTRDHNFRLDGLVGFDLHGKTVGVIGTGKIGQVFMDICRGFGMNILAYDKYPNEKLQVEYVDLKEIYERSDIISLHCPLTDDTYHIINSKAIKRMKKGVIILNTSRGALIDASALLEGIRDKEIGGACLDVYEEEAEVFYEDQSEMIPTDEVLSNLIMMPNVIVTSHQAFLTKEALNNIAYTTITNLKDWYSGRELVNEVSV